MDFSFSSYVDVSIVIICLVAGKAIKQLPIFSKIANRFIVVILPIIAVILKIGFYGFSLEAIATGLYSSLIAIGIHQTGKQLITKSIDSFLEQNSKDE